MGDYTKLKFDALLKSDIPNDVISVLKASSSGVNIVTPVPEHLFFKTDRWNLLINRCSLEQHAEGLKLSIELKLKNYTGEISKFCDWIGPWLATDQADQVVGSTEYLELSDGDAGNSFEYLILRNGSIMFRSRRVPNVASCIGCGCQRHAHENGCWWLRVDYTVGAGVCSQCEDKVQSWAAGERGKQSGVLEKIAFEDAYLMEVERELGRKLFSNEQEYDIWELYDDRVPPATAAARLTGLNYQPTV